MGGRRGGSVSGWRAPLGIVSGNRWLALFIIAAAAAIGMMVNHANREHDRRHAAFLAACAGAGQDVGRCDFYWLMIAQRAPSNDPALSLISATPR